jgi:hypothetical protein
LPLVCVSDLTGVVPNAWRLGEAAHVVR